MADKDQITILKINAELKERIRKASERKGLSMSAWLRMIAIEALDKEDRKSGD